MNAHSRTTFRTALPWPVVVGALMIGAFMMTLALQAAQARWLGWVTLLPLFLVIRQLAPIRAGLAAAFWGTCFAGFSTLAPHGLIDVSVQSFGLIALVTGVYGFLASHVTRRVGLSPLLLAIGWVGVEFALQPLSSHNGLLAGTQGDGLFIRTIGQVAGYILVAFLVAYVNATILEILTDVCQTAFSAKRVVESGVADEWFIPIVLPGSYWQFQAQSSPRGPPR